MIQAHERDSLESAEVEAQTFQSELERLEVERL